MNASEAIENLSAPERLRLAFEELGPTFIKLGQLLATRPDLVPEEFALEFSKLHDQVQPLKFEVIEAVLLREIGPDYKIKIIEVEPEPLGSASIAQVHLAKLASGEDVVVKVQRPQIEQIISDDLSVLYLLAELVERYLPESKIVSPRAIVDEFFKTLDLETNFVVEANNIRRFQKNFSGENSIRIPRINWELTTERVLVMEALPGRPLSQIQDLESQRDLANEVLQVALRAYLKMVFVDGLFHGDLHAGNFFLCPQNQVGLIDFGAVGRLNKRTQTSIANILLALAQEDYERMAHEYVDLAPFSEQVNIDLFAKDLRELIAPFFGLTLRNVNMGRLLLKSSAIAGRHGLSVPTELMMFFKSLIHIEGLGRRIQKDFDFLKHSLSFAGELVKHQLEPTKVALEWNEVLRESRNLIKGLPRQVHFYLRKINDPRFAARVEVQSLPEIKQTMELSSRLVFMGLVVASLVIGGAITANSGSTPGGGVSPISIVLFSVAGFLGFTAYIRYVLKS